MCVCVCVESATAVEGGRICTLEHNINRCRAWILSRASISPRTGTGVHLNKPIVRFIVWGQRTSLWHRCRGFFFVVVVALSWRLNVAARREGTVSRSGQPCCCAQSASICGFVECRCGTYTQKYCVSLPGNHGCSHDFFLQFCLVLFDLTIIYFNLCVPHTNTHT